MHPITGILVALYCIFCSAIMAQNNLPMRQIVDFARSLKATTDIASSISDVLQQQELKESCDRHFARLDASTDQLPASSWQNAAHISDMLRCGKWIFFFADFESDVAFPENLVRSGLSIFEEETGPGFANYGMLANPQEPSLPIGFSRLKGRPWGAVAGAVTGKPIGITCGACHFGQLPDGRYAVGKYNDQLDFGRLNAFLIFAAWMSYSDKTDIERWPTPIQEHFQKLFAMLKASRSPARALFDSMRVISWTKLDESFLKLVKMSIPTGAELESYMLGRPGVAYASSPLLPISREIDGKLQGVPFILSSPLIWDIENFEGDVEAGRAKPLSVFIPMNQLEDFIRGAYIFQTGRSDYSSPRYVDPLALYLRTLTTPDTLQPPSAEQRRMQGRDLFMQQCQSCHNGPNGESLEAHDPSLTGTAEIYVDPFVDYQPVHDLSARAYQAYFNTLGAMTPRGGIYARRLRGIRYRRNLMLNGMVDDLSHAFCLSKPRGEPLREAPYNDDVHMDLCQDYSEEERRLLLEYLHSWN